MTRAEQMRQYKAEGHTAKEVAARFGVTNDYARRICSGIAPQGQGVISESTVANRIKEKSNDRLEYVSGYTKKENPIIVRCNICGSEFERTYHHITTHPNDCPCCTKRLREQTLLKREAIAVRAEQKKKAKRFKRTQLITMCECAECGCLFVPSSKYRVVCSDDCKRKRNNRKPDSRLNDANIVDKDISLERLYERDRGVCQLCGGMCDWNDKTITDRGVIVGRNYPTRDHIIPLNKGGAHSWANIQLAHHYCNTLKSDKVDEV